MKELSVDRLREVLSYDPGTGVFTWNYSGKRMKPRAGDLAGCKDPRGYIQIRIDGKLHWAHRLAVVYITGKWPIGEVDHIDGNKWRNCLSNLRDVGKDVNMQNLRRPMLSNKSSGLLGVTWDKNNKKWKAAITILGKTKYLGLFDEAGIAHQAYLSAKREYHQGCTI